MPKFKVLMEQWFQEIAYVEVDADTPEQAIERADADYPDIDDWQDGDETKDFCIIDVRDADNNIVWEHP